MGHHTHTQLVNGQLLSVHVGCEAAGDKTDPMVIDLNAAGESPEQVGGFLFYPLKGVSRGYLTLDHDFLTQVELKVKDTCRLGFY